MMWYLGMWREEEYISYVNIFKHCFKLSISDKFSEWSDFLYRGRRRVLHDNILTDLQKDFQKRKKKQKNNNLFFFLL